MKRIIWLLCFSIILATVILTVLYWLSTPPPLIGDKVETRIYTRQTEDSIRRRIQLIDNELSELEYYLKVHGVQDEGYDLIARHYTRRRRDTLLLARLMAKDSVRPAFTHVIRSHERPFIAVRAMGGYWRAGHFVVGPLTGKAIARDAEGRVVRGIWDADTIVQAWRTDSAGTYVGQMNTHLQAHGQGTFVGHDGSHYEGYWAFDLPNGFGFRSSPFHHVQAGEWRNGQFLGERLNYTSERIYGIDVSRHQHEKGRKRFPVYWNKVRITNLGTLSKKQVSGQVDYPVTFVYIKATEGTTVLNRYYRSDYAQAKRQGIHVGTYHFFSFRSMAQAQAKYFLKHALIRKGDFPPVLDVEPTDAQIEKAGGEELMFSRIRTWLETVERQTGVRPILYVNQMFVNRHLVNAPDIKQKYPVWIARYGEYKPDVKLVFWQLCPDGRVNGISGPVDINVFNGYQGQFDEYLRSLRD